MSRRHSSRFHDKSLQQSPSPISPNSKNAMNQMPSIGQDINSNNTTSRPRRSRQSHNGNNNNNNDNIAGETFTARMNVVNDNNDNNNNNSTARSCCRTLLIILGYFVLLAVLLHNTMITNEKYQELLEITKIFNKVEEDNIYLGTQVINLRKSAENCTNKTLSVQDDLKACHEYIDLHCPIDVNELEMNEIDQTTTTTTVTTDTGNNEFDETRQEMRQEMGQGTNEVTDRLEETDDSADSENLVNSYETDEIGAEISLDNGGNMYESSELEDMRKRDEAMDGLAS